MSEVGATGYFVVQALAASNLRLGHEVIGDSVNPVEESRQSWRKTAQSVDSVYVEIELICSDTNEHRKRAEQRVVGIEGLKQPSWQDICDRHYETWSSVDLRLDTSILSVTEAVDQIEALIERRMERKRL